jgi:putative ABC transport system permease protein
MTVLQELRFGMRMLLKSPSFTLIAIATLALGIGVNTAIFSVVNAVMVRPLPYERAHELTMSHFTNARGEKEWQISPAAYRELQSLNSVFTEIAAWGNNTWPANLTGDREPEKLDGLQVSGNFFPVLGVAPAHGRTFVAEEDRPGNNHVVVISHDLWQRESAATRE